MDELSDEMTAGLPPSAAERMRRQRESQVAGSLLSAPALAALAAAGLEPAGEVMGCIVMHLGWSGYGCGGYGSYNQGRPGMLGYQTYAPTPVITSANGRAWQGYAPYVRALEHANDRALGRMLIEAGALGADGVVGVRLTWSSLDSGARELVALGTAVRHKDPGRRRPQGTMPYCTELSGEDVAAAALAGWQPLAIVIALSVAIKHDDWAMQWQTASGGILGFGAGNIEVDGLTALVHAARSQARAELTRKASGFTRTGQVVISRTDLRIRERACVNDQRDHIAEATFTGTVLRWDGRTAAPQRPRALSILPLRGERR